MSLETALMSGDRVGVARFAGVVAERLAGPQNRDLVAAKLVAARGRARALQGDRAALIDSLAGVVFAVDIHQGGSAIEAELAAVLEGRVGLGENAIPASVIGGRADTAGGTGDDTAAGSAGGDDTSATGAAEDEKVTETVGAGSGSGEAQGGAGDAAGETATDNAEAVADVVDADPAQVAAEAGAFEAAGGTSVSAAALKAAAARAAAGATEVQADGDAGADRTAERRADAGAPKAPSV